MSSGGLWAPGEVGERDLLKLCDWLDFLPVEQPGDINQYLGASLVEKKSF